MAIQPEQVIIEIIAKENALGILENIAGKLRELSILNSKLSSLNVSNPVKFNDADLSKIANFQDKINQFKKNANVSNTVSESVVKSNSTMDSFGSTIDNVSKRVLGLKNNLKDVSKVNVKPSSLDEVYSKLDTARKNASNNLKDYQMPQYVRSVNTTSNAVSPVREIKYPSLPPRHVQGELTGVNSTLLSTNSTMTTLGQSTIKTYNEVNKMTQSYDMLGKKGSESANRINKGFSVGRSSFHELNNLLIAVGGQFNNLATSIAGLFGANSLGGMIEKMWKGAAERQTNMLYLMHQRGADEANKYYNEIMDIVTQLPGDDTFLTNILNMSAAMDKNIKLDNLKELGSAITDFYIASTMKGELPFETERDIRKYMTTGDTRGLRNSLLASELDLLKDKNSVLERGKALQEALDKTGFTGMSQYESATNALEEFKGHFQKAFADLGTIVTGVVQPILKLYNILDTLFGSRLSQALIVVGAILVGFFTVLGTGMIMTSVFFRNFEMLGQSLEILSIMLKSATTSQSLFNVVMMEALGVKEANAIAEQGGILASMRNIKVTYQNIIAKELYNLTTTKETVSIWGLITATASLIKTKLVNIATIIKEIIFGVNKNAVREAEYVLNLQMLPVEADELAIRQAHNTLTVHSINLKLRENVAKAKGIVTTTISTIRNIIHSDSNLLDATTNEINTLATEHNSIAVLRNVLVKFRSLLTTLRLCGSIILATIMTWRNTESTFAEAYAHASNTGAKVAETGATFGLATATAILDIVMAPITVTIMLIVGAILALIVVMEKVGEMFGWWKDFGSMFEAISSGINKLWNAFMNSEVIQGIIQYFRDFFSVVQYLYESVSNLFGKLFGWSDNNGTFDIVQSIVEIFGKLGEVIKWVWNLLDDFSNSPLGILTWLNPLTILIFHLDEIGSLFEDIGDAINRFTESEEFTGMMDALGQAWEELQEPFQEIWTLITEILGLLGGFSEDPVGQGTEDRINAIAEVFKFIANIIRYVIVPAIRGLAFIINIILTPIKIILEMIKTVFKVINQISDAIKNSFIGKLFGWDDDSNNNNKNLVNGQGRNLTGSNINNTRNLGSTYNNNTSQRHVIINQNFSEGSMPIDARNMTKKEARKMFIGAFGYNRSVGSKGILR